MQSRLGGRQVATPRRLATVFGELHGVLGLEVSALMLEDGVRIDGCADQLAHGTYL